MDSRSLAPVIQHHNTNAEKVAVAIAGNLERAERSAAGPRSVRRREARGPSDRRKLMER